MSALQTAFDFLRAAVPRLRPAPEFAPEFAPEPAPSSVLARQVLERLEVVEFERATPLARPLTSLEAALGARLQCAVQVAFTDNTRTMVSARRRAGVLCVRLHRMFVHADPHMLEVLARFLHRRDARATTALRDFIAEHQGQVRRRRERRVLLSAIGEHHDLRLIFDELNAIYFDGSVEARIGWGRMGTPLGRRRRRRSIKLGSYWETGALIRVHPVLDAGWVPRFFVEYIVYHEMLHHVVQMPVRGGRRCMHGAEFKARERMFAQYAEAIAWERKHLDRLLAS